MIAEYNSGIASDFVQSLQLERNMVFTVNGVAMILGGRDPTGKLYIGDDQWFKDGQVVTWRKHIPFDDQLMVASWRQTGTAIVDIPAIPGPPIFRYFFRVRGVVELWPFRNFTYAEGYEYLQPFGCPILIYTLDGSSNLNIALQNTITTKTWFPEKGQPDTNQSFDFNGVVVNALPATITDFGGAYLIDRIVQVSVKAIGGTIRAGPFPTAEQDPTHRGSNWSNFAYRIWEGGSDSDGYLIEPLPAGFDFGTQPLNPAPNQLSYRNVHSLNGPSIFPPYGKVVTDVPDSVMRNVQYLEVQLLGSRADFSFVRPFIYDLVDPIKQA